MSGPPRGMMRWLRSLFAWRDVKKLGVWLYQENTITGARRAIKLANLHGPQHSQWPVMSTRQ